MEKRFTLPELQYEYAALEPHIDAKTMEIHHTKHHQGYTDKLNKALEDKNVFDPQIEEILSNISKHNDAIRNNAGGYYNHKLFWSILSPDGGGQPKGDFVKALDDAFGSFDEFKKSFAEAASGQFGSGWAWLSLDNDDTLFVSSTPNQDNPLMDVAELQGTPILGLDVWEHAYYLNYQNKRGDYIDAFWNMVDWDAVADNYKEAYQ